MIVKENVQTVASREQHNLPRIQERSATTAVVLFIGGPEMTAPELISYWILA